MAQAQEPMVGQKRGPGRPPKHATPAAKRLKTAAAVASTPPTSATPIAQSPAVDSPAPEKRGPRLPAKVSDTRPLPSLPEPQPLDLSDDYQSIAASAVLQASLNRSRSKWVSDGIFQRYWVKPESGKNAKPLPPNNPDVKSMKSKGECRIRLEPHLLVADVYVEEKPRPKQSSHSQASYGQYRPAQAQQFQNRPVQPVQTPIQQQPSRASQAPAPVTTPLQDKKASPDPVISMLASRASSDPELKALMKEVATGNATPDQLRVFQRHIDELTDIIVKQKKDGDQQAVKAASDKIKYDGASSTKSQSSTPLPQAQQQAPHLPQPQPFPMYSQQPAWAPPTHPPVILEFKTVGATEDRFLFPQHSILESLSPQHELVSFIVTRKGREAADSAGLEPNKEYWQPVTMMVEVAYGREGILRNIRDWVKPADQVRKHMEDVMQSCQKAPTSFLAFRLPIKSSAAAESEDASKDSTPVVEAVERLKPKAAKKSMTPRTSVGSPLPQAPRRTSIAKEDPGKPVTQGASRIEAAAPATAQTAPTVAGPDNETGETGRPRRAVRKSVRISEG